MIKKIAGLAAACVVIGNFAYAEDAFSSTKFIGLEVGATQVQGDVGGILAIPDNKITGIEYGLRVGAQKALWRTTVILNYFDKDDQNTEKLLATFDYFFLNKYGKNTEMLKPYFGLNMGYVNYESTNIDESGLLYGGQAGVVLNMTENIDFDLSYRYSLSEVDSFDHSGSVMFGLNYLY